MGGQEARNNFDEQLDRILWVTGTHTQLELADFLGVHRSSVLDAQKSGKIPADWLLTILCAKDVHPEWILTGDGSCFISSRIPIGHYDTGETVQERWRKEEALRRLSSKDLRDELLRRIAISQAEHFTK